MGVAREDAMDELSRDACSSRIKSRGHAGAVQNVVSCLSAGSSRASAFVRCVCACQVVGLPQATAKSKHLKEHAKHSAKRSALAAHG